MVILTPHEAAEFLKVSRDIIYELVYSEGFPAAKVGGQWRIPRELLEKWVEDKVKAVSPL